MTVLAYALMLAFTVAIAAAWDEVWLRYIRPILADQYGWPEVKPDERIPAVGWMGGLAAFSILFIFLPFVGVSPGY